MTTPLPTDTVSANDWAADPSTGRVSRFFTGTEHGADIVRMVRDGDLGVRVDIVGFQDVYGDVNRTIHVYAPDQYLDAEGARRVAAGLLAAADELERLSG